MSKNGEIQQETVKWLMRYIKWESQLCLTYTKGKDSMILINATDLDMRRSISGYVFNVRGNIVSWKSNFQPVVALSTNKAECSPYQLNIMKMYQPVEGS